LRDRNGPASPPRPTGRNLFEFMTARAPHDGVPTPALPSDASTPAPAPAMPAHGLKLVGLAEESDASGPVRTAIVSSGRELFFVKEGERVGDRYRVVRISGDAVELSDAAVAEPIRLVLK
jgi:hypothetical protein